MSKHVTSLVSLAAVLSLALVLVPHGTVTRAHDARPASMWVAQGDEDAPPATIDERLGGTTGPVKVVVELVDDPSAEVYGNERRRGGSEAQATAAARARLAAINQAQQQVANQLTALGGRMIYRTQRVYNGVATIVDASQLRTIARLPNVQAIHRLNTKYRDNNSSVPLIGAPQMWAGAGGAGATGTGMKIAIIDSGIDYIHTDFGGDGTAASYAANDTTTLGDSPFFGGANKVAGGYDFAGDDYNADPDSPAYQPIPKPDPDPSDCLSDPATVGHGTHVAGTAAGFGVQADGTTYRGPYDTTTPVDAMRIGPGVAPEARLYALRVFGCDGSTDVTDQAIEYAVDPNRDGDFSDRMDVINMSLGSAYGSDYDTSAVASNNAVLAGVVVVASAGNSGDVYYINGSPGTASRALSVAASQDKRDMLDGFRVNAPPSIAGVYPGNNSVAYAFPTGPITGMLAYPSTQPSACQAFNDTNKALLAGKIALLDWTKLGGVNECGSVARTTNAADAGAIGVLFVYPDPILDIAITGSARIPSIITGREFGEPIKARVVAGESVTVTLTPEYNGTQQYDNDTRTDTLASFSSRGPRRVDNALKPDITAPGQTTFSALVQSGNKGQSLNGTSMAAPHVAGAMALLRQLHPTWTVEELKALAMNTAASEVRSGLDPASALYAPARTGAGRITLQQAAENEVIAYRADGSGLVSVSFGAPEVVGILSATRTVRVANKGTATQAFDVTYAGRPATDVPGVTFSVAPNTLMLAPGAVAELTVTMTANSAAMQHSRDTTMAATQGGLPRHWLSEESGLVVLSRGGTDVVRVPVYAAPRPASAMRAATSSFSFGTQPAATTSLLLAGREVNTGSSFPLDERSVVTAFEWQLASPNDPQSTGAADTADLKAVGVASDAPRASAFANAQLFFGIATYGNWSTPSSSAVEFDIYIDTNRDGGDDFVLFNTNPSQTDVFQTALVDLRTGRMVAGGGDFLNGVPASVRNTVVYNTSVMVLPVSAAKLGLTASNARFNYRVVSFSRDFDDPEGLGVDNSGVDAQDQAVYLTYDAANPGIDLSSAAGVPAYDDLPGASIPVRFNRAAYDANRSQGILLLHHHNRTGAHDEVVRIIVAPFPQATPTAGTTTTATVQPSTTATVQPSTTATTQPAPTTTAGPGTNKVYLPHVFR